MMITYYIAVRTSKLKMMTDEDILQNIDKKLEIRSVYGVKAGSKTY